MNAANLPHLNLSSIQPGSQLKDYIYERSRRCFAEGDAQRDAAVRSPEALRQRQQELRTFLVECFGGLPPSDTPLNACTTGVEKGDGFSIEKVIYEPRPGHKVTANLYLPDTRQERTPAVLFLCGHSEKAKAYANYQFVCQSLAHAGLIVLAQDPVGQGERLSYYDPVRKRENIRGCVPDHDYAGMQCLLVGDNIARYFLHDAMRSIDYLVSRPEVDPSRIGVTGNSGGGTQTSLVMMADPRIAAAAPATFIMNRDTYQRAGQAQDAEQIWGGFTAAGYDHEDILMAMAPRPACVLAVTSDFFPIEGARRSVERARRAWETLGVSADRLELVEDHSTHAYTENLARAATRFFVRHLLGREEYESPRQPRLFPVASLQCTSSGQVSGDFPDARFVFDANLERLRAAEMARREFSREQGVEWLRNQIFARRERNPTNPRLMRQREPMDDLEIDKVFWFSQPYLANAGLLFRSTAPGMPEKRGITLALWDGGTGESLRHLPWLRKECATGRAVLVLDLCGMGMVFPDPVAPAEGPGALDGDYGTFRKLADDLLWIGDSLPALRAFELTRVPEMLEAMDTRWPDLDRGDLRIHAHGKIGVHAVLASMVEPRLGGCEWVDGFCYGDIAKNRYYPSFGMRPLILPGVLRYFDL